MLSKRAKFMSIAAAAGFAVVSISPPLMFATDPPAMPAAEVVQPLTLPAGFESKDIGAVEGVKSGLVKLAERAVSKGDFNSFLAELSKQDKERAREFKGADQSRLDGLVTQIQSEWKAKYGEDFSIGNKNLVFNDQFQVAQGVVTDPEIAISNWPVPAQSGQAITAADRSDAKTQKDEARNAKLTKGTEVAIIRFPGNHVLPETNVSMIHQLLFWRIDIPNDRTGEQIYNDLLSNLQFIQDHQDKWPSDVNAAYTMVAHHAVAAVYGVGVSPE